MIYETIPVNYFDHTALLEAIQEANSIRVGCAYWANEAAEYLMDDDNDVTSGQAVETGEFINWNKNIEYLVNHWIYTLTKIVLECKMNIPSFDKSYTDALFHKWFMMENDGKLDPYSAINDAYKEWKQHTEILARNYGVKVARFRTNMCSNGEAERLGLGLGLENSN